MKTTQSRLTSSLLALFLAGLAGGANAQGFFKKPAAPVSPVAAPAAAPAAPSAPAPANPVPVAAPEKEVQKEVQKEPDNAVVKSPVSPAKPAKPASKAPANAVVKSPSKTSIAPAAPKVTASDASIKQLGELESTLDSALRALRSAK